MTSSLHLPYHGFQPEIRMMNLNMEREALRADWSAPGSHIRKSSTSYITAIALRARVITVVVVVAVVIVVVATDIVRGVHILDLKEQQTQRLCSTSPPSPNDNSSCCCSPEDVNVDLHLCSKPHEILVVTAATPSRSFVNRNLEKKEHTSTQHVTTQNTTEY
jgi:hypothetical protein